MSQVVEPQRILTVFRLLLGDRSVDVRELDWSAVRAVAERDHVMLQLASSLKQRAVPLPTRFAEAVEQARLRADRIFRLIARIGETGNRRGVPHVFLKVAQRYPDVGRDVDVLVAGAAEMDNVLLDHIPALPGQRHLGTYLAGTSMYPVPEYATVIDVHHDCLGTVGEHRRFASVLLRRRRMVRLGPVTCFVPSPEDQVLLLALRQIHPQFALRVSDIAWVVTMVRERRVDWDLLTATARSTGLLDGLSCHLHYIDQVHRELLGRPLLDTAHRSRLASRSCGRVEFREGAFQVRAARVSGELFLRQVGVEARSGDWRALGRLCLLPVLALSAGWRRLRHQETERRD
jgi:hypothetical protein